MEGQGCSSVKVVGAGAGAGRMTVTEALADIKTSAKRIEKKREFVRNYLWRQGHIKDPHEKNGGSTHRVACEQQAIKDLEATIVLLRFKIAQLNAKTEVEVGGETKTVAEWLIWRRDVVPDRRGFLTGLQTTVVEVQRGFAGVRAGGEVVQAVQGHEPSGVGTVAINVDQLELAGEIERIEKVLGELDGKLSHRNATTFVEL